MPNVPSVLVVGGGLTSAAVSRALRRQLSVESVTVWEALGSLGGRMHTERTSVLGAAGLADTGAQYVTVTDDNTSDATAYCAAGEVTTCTIDGAAC